MPPEQFIARCNTEPALELENPPLLIVSDRERIEIHTAFTSYLKGANEHCFFANAWPTHGIGKTG